MLVYQRVITESLSFTSRCSSAAPASPIRFFPAFQCPTSTAPVSAPRDWSNHPITSAFSGPSHEFPFVHSWLKTFPLPPLPEVGDYGDWHVQTIHVSKYFKPRLCFKISYFCVSCPSKMPTSHAPLSHRHWRDTERHWARDQRSVWEVLPWYHLTASSYGTCLFSNGNAIISCQNNVGNPMP